MALASTLTQVQAETFWLVAAHITGFGGPVGHAGAFFVKSPDIDCATLIDQDLVPEASDVSGGGDGVRVKWTDGDCGSNGWLTDGQCPAEVEQNLPDRHQSKSPDFPV